MAAARAMGPSRGTARGLICFPSPGPPCAGKLDYGWWSGNGERDEAIEASEAQIAFLLKQADTGMNIGEVRLTAGISGATFYHGRKRYAGLITSEIKRLRQLEEESSKLQQLVEAFRDDAARRPRRIIVS